ncbi:hypothetical protein GWO43_27185 [candidate division KSB1 bacterium]|nr:hypothetical protein [candidate division KSB1 bacterium]NIR70336.1 hypothetical protein [candidate division KSB1 bacterium]NIS27640.1 hypothetical protein [candidate division KSB1 bacterium]NIT74480.1 hypothetical protein [candidate division KSB1 bacterium]NIU29005.1 hypothetical protein [candidate division KSB1 bacterium]
MQKLRFLVKLGSTILMMALFIWGCEYGSESTNPIPIETTSGGSGATLAKVGRTQVWADCELFDSVVTPATFKPESDPFDELYAANFKDGVGLISESKPGDADYNGGRWHMNVLKAGIDPDKYEDACSVEELDLNDFQSSGNYFECPLLPRRGNRNR